MDKAAIAIGLPFALWAGLSAAAERVDREPMLSAHNGVRAEVGAPPLRWSDQLAGDAAEWADYLAEQKACGLEHDEAREGENLFWASPRYWSDGRVTLQPVAPAEVVKSWASEKADYDYAGNTCRGEQCGHYTQIVWRDTEQVGCAKRICPDKAQIWVCRYAPPGNIVGQRPY